MAKIMNEYAQALEADLYERIPKAVLAAIAVSLAVRLGGMTGYGEDPPTAPFVAARGLILEEWEALHENGIVPQDLPAGVACECGGLGKHPYPIGGGWAWACDDCKAASLVRGGGDDPFGPTTAADWDRWAGGPVDRRPDHVAASLPAGETPLGEDLER